MTIQSCWGPKGAPGLLPIRATETVKSFRASDSTARHQTAG